MYIYIYIHMYVCVTVPIFFYQYCDSPQSAELWTPQRDKRLSEYH